MKRRYNSEESKRKILSACVKLFIEQGYHNTTLAEVLKEAEVSSSTFQNIFHSKDGVLLELTDFMFDSQFMAARGAAEKLKPLYIYALETAIQLTLAELNENLRDIYVEAYSVERVTERIYERTSTSCSVFSAAICRNAPRAIFTNTRSARPALCAITWQKDATNIFRSKRSWCAFWI